MKMGADWSAYCEEALAREKKKNTTLAGRLADAEAKRVELEEKYQRILSNPLYKLSRPFRIFSAIKRRLHTVGVDETLCAPDSAELRRYEEELELRKNPYGLWIKEKEPALFKEMDEQLAKIESCDFSIIGYNELAGVKGFLSEKKQADVYILAENPTELEEKAEEWFCRYFKTYPEHGIAYAQEDYFYEGGRCRPWFKPIWSENTLFSFFYFGRCLALTKEVAEKTELSGLEDGRKNLYDFLLRACRSTTPGLLDLVLYHKKAEEEPEEVYWGAEEEFCTLKQNFLRKEYGLESFCYQTWNPELWTVIPMQEEKKVSIIIPSKDHLKILKKAVDSLLSKTDYPREKLEIIVVDNGSTEENRKNIEEYLNRTGASFLYLYEPMEFNFSKMCNLGAEAATGELLLLLNDDIEIIEEHWLKILTGQMMIERTGAVSAKLWYPEGEKIQHAGVTNMEIGPSHKLVTFPDHKNYYYGHNSLPYDMLAVTGACLLVDRSVYKEIGGMDETMAVSYNDVDFSFRLTEHGYHNVVRNDAVLLHHESVSRGLDADSDAKWDRLLKEKENLYKKHALYLSNDPFYSAHLTGNEPGYITKSLHPEKQQLATVSPKEEKNFQKFFSRESDALMLTVERAIIQRKIHASEPEIALIEGWCYLLNGENCRMERLVILKNVDGTVCYSLPVYNAYRPDVEAILPMQHHVAMSGFVSRVCVSKLHKGTYRVGMSYTDKKNGRKYCRDSMVELHVK